jgi:cellulose synthase/poly-beta-1,6-N-acetylglucosamine synthase-like glycosyltransferase
MNIYAAALWGISLASALVYLGLLARLGSAWRHISRPGPRTTSRPISIVIAARNEAHRLERCLTPLLAQEYSDWEIIVALDRCSDGSRDLLTAMQEQQPRLRFIEITETPPGWAPKKWALTQAISAARHAHLAFTDADCRVGPQWLRHIDAAFGEGNELVLGLGPYETEKGLLNRIIRFETSYTALQYIGMACLGQPYMGVGRNLAYTRQFFLQHGGFGAFRSSLSGDDDLMVNHYADPARTAVMTAPGSETWSEPAHTWQQWFRQKTRHVSASLHYKKASMAFLGAFHLSHSLFYISLLAGAVTFSASLSFMLYIARILLSLCVIRRTALQTDRLPEMLRYPVLDLLYFLYNLTVVPIGFIRKPSWRN